MGFVQKLSNRNLRVLKKNVLSFVIKKCKF